MALLEPKRATLGMAERLSGAGFGSHPRQLHAEDFGCTLPTALYGGDQGQRQQVLLETLDALAKASPTARYHRLAQENVRRWKGIAGRLPASSARVIRVLPGDWGAVTAALTREFGEIFASLNMANAYGPGGGYTDGMVAQEENMFRRTDCHFSLAREDEYTSDMTALLSGQDGRVYLDMEHPRVCIRGPEDRSVPDLGYAWLTDEEVFPFYELRAAAVDLRNGDRFDEKETTRRIEAQLETLISAGVRHVVLSAFGCGAFCNPARRVAAAYRKALSKRTQHFDVIGFAIFNAGYGPDNFTPFRDALEVQLERVGGSVGSNIAEKESFRESF